jgi:integrase/recombinase XerC
MVVRQVPTIGSYAWVTANQRQVLQLNQDISVLERIIGRGDLAGQVDAFLLTCKVDGCSNETINGYRRKLSLFVRFLASLNISQPEQVTINHVRLFILEKQKTINGVSINTLFRAYRRWFNWMVKEHVLEVSPMAGMTTPKIPKAIIQPFKPEQIQAMLAMCDNSFLGVRNRAMVLTFYDSGLRLLEMSNVRLADIDVERGCIKVWGKGAKERVVGLGQLAQRAVYRYVAMRRDCLLPWLWVTDTKDNQLQSRGIETMIQCLGQRAGIQGVRCSPHTFRHSFATTALKNGASVFEVQSLLGHSTSDMTRRYTATLNSEQAVINHKRFSPADNLK